MSIFCLCVKRAFTTPTQTRQLHMLAAGPHFSRSGRDNCRQRRHCTSHATDEVPQTPSVDSTIPSPTCSTAHPCTTHYQDAPSKMFELTHLPNTLGVAPPDIQRFEKHLRTLPFPVLHGILQHAPPAMPVSRSSCPPVCPPAISLGILLIWFAMHPARENASHLGHATVTSTNFPSVRHKHRLPAPQPVVLCIQASALEKWPTSLSFRVPHPGLQNNTQLLRRGHCACSVESVRKRPTPAPSMHEREKTSYVSSFLALVSDSCHLKWSRRFCRLNTAFLLSRAHPPTTPSAQLSCLRVCGEYGFRHHRRQSYRQRNAQS